MEILKRLAILLWCALPICALTQPDFNNYTPILSKGQIPVDFTQETYLKIKAELQNGREELNRLQEKVFFEGTNYAIDELLHSGLVVYGDPISEYVTAIAQLLLKDDAQTFQKLRFYTIKSNIANAFSTDQGILFVTTGLIMQLSSEAELAFIIAHEIAHFVKGHVVNTFDWRTKNRYFDEQIEHLSQYVQEHELEADKVGLELYYKAGYSPQAINSTFDVLMYSYLPFDEKPFPTSYFNTAQLFVPANIFTTQKYPITAIEDYDDLNSSHPNIKRRKSSIDPEIVKRTNWQESLFKLSDSQFYSVRTLARFESVRLNILDVNYADALYTIFLLESDYPQSIYLKRMKSHAWLNFMLYKNENLSNKTIRKENELEGESATLHVFLKRLNKDGVNTLALRTLYDAYSSNPKDIELKTLYEKLVVHLVRNSHFKIDDYSTLTFQEAVKKVPEAKKDTAQLQQLNTGSKYDRIKKTKIAVDGQAVDSAKFYLYGIQDIIKDSSFLRLYKDEVTRMSDEKKLDESIVEMSRKERKAAERELFIKNNTLKSNEIIVVEPSVISYRRGSIDYVKSEKLERVFSESITQAGELTGIKTYPIDSRSLNQKGTAGYNERSVLITLLNQLSAEDEMTVFPVDFQQLQTILNDYGTSNVLFSLVEHTYNPGITFQGIFTSIFVYPVLLVYLPVALLTGNHTEMTTLILDIQTGTIQTGINYYFKDNPKKLQLGAHMFDIFTNLKRHE